MEMNLSDVKVDDVIRYQFYMNCINHYEKVEKVTNHYIILKNGKKFNKNDGWGTSKDKNYHIAGINDQEEHYHDDLADIYYY